jgi:Ca-activated chloride channel family protein
MQARRLFTFSFTLTALAVILLVPGTQRTAMAAPGKAAGTLEVIRGGKGGAFCPLQHTDVKATISGMIAHVSVTQEFANASGDTIEAVYTFPLPQDAAVDDMTIQIGERTIRGVIKRREEAAQIYAKAIASGHTAALLDQERPNIFTQTVGNIPAGAAVQVSITYLARLKYEDGGYEFVFPMVVGPRYIPGSQAIGKQGGGIAPDTDQVPDASRITPAMAPEGTRAGHDISLELTLDAGVPIQALRSPTHEIESEPRGASSAVVRLRNEAEIPNKDFILRYAVAGTAIAEGVLTHTAAALPNVVAGKVTAAQTNGYFTMVIQPPERFPESDISPKELVFVMDSSGSMSGFPEAKSKRLIDHAIDGLYAGDTFNVIKFAGDTAVLFEEPVYPTAENVRKAKAFLNGSWGGGGTEMMKAIRAALAPSDAADHVRIVVFLTDGYVGNDMEIISEIQKHQNARIFAYGIGSSVNRFLLDKMAEAGRGVVEYVSQKQDEKEAEAAANRLYERLRAPLLTDISVDFGTLPVADVYPRRIPDLFSAKPVIITGRYTRPAKGTVRLTGKRAGDPYTREIAVDLPEQEQSNDALASLWAREKIDDLMSQDWSGLQNGQMKDELRNEITQVGLDHRLMTQFTSFVAVEDKVVTEGGAPKRIQVPVELPEGVQYEPGWAGADKASITVNAQVSVMSTNQAVMVTGAAPMISQGSAATYTWTPPVLSKSGGNTGMPAPPPPPPSATPSNGTGSGASTGAGSGGGISGGVYRVRGGVVARADAKKVAPPRPIDVKVHPRLVAAYDCWRSQFDKSKAASDCKLRSERMLVEVILAENSKSALEELKALGFDASTEQPRRNRVVGRIAVERLAKLAEVKGVQFVAPASAGQER